MRISKLWFWLLIFTLLNLVTALFTELYNDEAYYWAYSRFLDWGYFDHPPVIALLIKIGYAIIPGELGVRLLSLLSVSAGLWLISKTSQTKDVKLFVLLMFSVFPFFLFGFTALPDSPMLFSIALFFWTYQQFIKDESWKWTLVLAVVMAFMLYTKYMGVLIILFTLTSNLNLLKRKWFWLASIIGAFLFLPHLYWQYVNDFPSVQYHLVDRSAKAYNYSFTLEYIGAQLFFLWPICWCIFILGCFAHNCFRFV
jgi:4-amino-4-deoxy-L-arabinose transferase-like glycosyltransferase